MNAISFVNACQQGNPAELYETALEVFESDLPDELYDNYDIPMTIELLCDALYEEKQFDKVETLAGVLRRYQPELYQLSLFTLLPDLIYFYLFKGDIHTADYYMRELALAPEEDFLLFVHLLDVLDSYGYTEVMNQIVTDVITTDTHLDADDQNLLESYLVEVAPQTADATLRAVRRRFVAIAPFYGITTITAENIVDALTDYYDDNAADSHAKLLLNPDTFRAFITTLLDLEFLDTYEYAAAVLWGSVYLNEALVDAGLLSKEELAYNLSVIERMKAFFLVNIPWDGYWRLRFLSEWKRPKSISRDSAEAERMLFEHNLVIRPKEIVGHSVTALFGPLAAHLPYAKYLKEEEAEFEKAIARTNAAEYGAEKKKDSVFPFFNYLSGESEGELRPKPASDHGAHSK
jgi:hypothetical protein